MAIESMTEFRHVSKETITLPPGDIVVTPGLAEHLQITDTEALQPGRLLPFLRRQAALYLEIVEREEIKTQAAEIPACRFDDESFTATSLTPDEEEALKGWCGKARTLLSQSNGGADDLAKEIEDFIDGAVKNNPDVFSTGDLLGDMMTGEIYRDTAESKRKWQELLAAASDPASIILLLAQRQSEKTSKLMGRAFEALKFNQDRMMQLDAQMSLEGKNLDAAGLAKANMDFAKFSTDANQIYGVIQKAVGDYERIFTYSDSLIKSMGKAEQVMAQNIKP